MYSIVYNDAAILPSQVRIHFGIDFTFRYDSKVKEFGVVPLQHVASLIADWKQENEDDSEGWNAIAPEGQAQVVYPQNVGDKSDDGGAHGGKLA